MQYNYIPQNSALLRRSRKLSRRNCVALLKLFQLEELRERKFDGYARVIQRAFHKYFAKRQRQKQQEQAAAIVYGKKQRRKYSINRIFVGDYIGELISIP
jgi:hypothetical protein